MRNRSGLLFVLMIAAAVVRPSAQSPTLSTAMNQKADNAQRLLRPLVVGDFTGISRYADRLGRLTYAEVASWQARPDGDYIRHATDFVKGVQDLREAARQRNLEHATDAYTAIVTSCVQCHRQVRGERAVSFTPGPGVVVPPNGGVH